jgi:hypothetical protein
LLPPWNMQFQNAQYSNNGITRGMNSFKHNLATQKQYSKSKHEGLKVIWWIQKKSYLKLFPTNQVCIAP